jgi:hypothetical protein
LQLEAQHRTAERHRRFDVGVAIRETPHTGGRIRKRYQSAAWVLPANGTGRGTPIVACQAHDPLVEEARPSEERRIAS